MEFVSLFFVRLFISFVFDVRKTADFANRKIYEFVFCFGWIPTLEYYTKRMRNNRQNEHGKEGVIIHRISYVYLCEKRLFFVQNGNDDDRTKK